MTSRPPMLYVLSADPSGYPFTHAPSAKVEGRTLLHNTVSEYLAAGVDPGDLLCAGSDEEVLLSARRLGIATLKTADGRKELFGLMELEQFRKYERFVLCSMLFPFFDKSAVVKAALTQSLSGRLLIVQESSLPTVLPVGAAEQIAEVRYRSPEGLPFPHAQTVLSLKTPWSVRTLKDLRALEILRARKRIVFHAEAYTEIGMGHLYRGLSIASHLQQYDVRFVCSDRSPQVSAMTSSWNYPVTVCKGRVTPEDILRLQPTLVVNDVLNTDAAFTKAIARGCKVVNFEDLGDGAAFAHAVVNDLYEAPVAVMSGGYWGHEYYFLREEFEAALPRPCPETVRAVLLTFGGTDPNDLTRKVFRTIYPVCKKRGIRIHVVTGSGYGRVRELTEELQAVDGAMVEHIHRTGIMSSIMERSDIAICSNGRTVYEMSHMHLPSVVICHHEREATHAFAREENGFINLGVFRGSETLDELSRAFLRLTDDRDFRVGLYEGMMKLDFKSNKERVLKILTDLMEGK